ncbi:hypothetical protein QBC45DRAFT_448965 [Copromyces sp. CBS 386.78]|nr:hypothetical protein QBC45DRAFT_448965 [Copromyces sp. CBS 386.78]
MSTESCMLTIVRREGGVLARQRCECQIHNSSPVFWQSWRRPATGIRGGGGGHEPCCVTVTFLAVTPAVSAFCVCVRRTTSCGGPGWLGCLSALFLDLIQFFLRVSSSSEIFDTHGCSRHHDRPMGRTEDTPAPV